MRKLLLASSALVAFAVAGTAKAAEPITLELGGFMQWFLAYGDHDEDIEGPGTDFSDFNVFGNNEVFFKGNTTLDNGIQIGLDIQLEAGGNSSPVDNGIDEHYLTVDGGFGRFIIGAENNVAYLFHVSAPVAAGAVGFDEGDFFGGSYVAQPSGFSSIGGGSTAINTDGDQRGISYITPSFSGFQAGVTWKAGGATNGLSGTGVLNEQDAGLDQNYTLSLSYGGEFGPVGIRASAGYFTGDSEALSDHDEYSAGLQLAWTNWTFGGGYRLVNSDPSTGAATSLDGDAWNIGVNYAMGPFAVSLGYMQSIIDGAVADPDEDEGRIYQATGRYNIGPGIDVLGVLGYAEWDEEGTVDAEGWTAVTGITLAF